MAEMVIPAETTVEVTNEVMKKFDGESFAMGAAAGTALATGLYLLVKKVCIPTVQKIRVKVQTKKGVKVAEYESDGFEEEKIE